jgi:hypothetical protein
MLVLWRSWNNVFWYQCPPTVRWAGFRELVLLSIIALFVAVGFHIIGVLFSLLTNHAAGLLLSSGSGCPAVSAGKLFTTEFRGMYHLR